MIFVNAPLITCVMVTKGRYELVKKSVKCYINQIYKNRNLIILSQSNIDTNVKIQSFLNDLQRDDILFISAPENISLGLMRNTSVELATGDIICQWDDDDLYHPNRILSQYKVLISNSKAIASVYTQFLKYFYLTSELYWSDWEGEKDIGKYLCGSIMFYKKYFHFFNTFYPSFGEQSDVEEDLNILHKLASIGLILPVTNGHEYIYVYHGQNTYDLKHHLLSLNLKSGKKLLSVEELLNKKSLLETTFKLVDVNNTVNVKSENQTVFTWSPLEI